MGAMILEYTPSNLVARWDHLESITNYWCLRPISQMLGFRWFGV